MNPTAQVQVPTIPATAWEQAAIIIVVLIFFLLVLYGVYRVMIVVKSIVDDTNKSFQTFLVEQRKADHQEQQERESAFSARNAKIVEALDELIKGFQEHDTKTDRAIERMEAIVNKPAPRPRSK